jgi:SAM-dependent methyltransferase
MTTADVLPLPIGFDHRAPTISVDQVPACPVCSSHRRSYLTCGHDYELETCRNEWHFWRCSDCSAIWLDPRPANDTLDVIYPQHYYAYAMSEKISSFALKGKEILDRIKFNKILRHAPSPTSFLDIGCGDGRYLKMLSRRGIPKERIYGLELSGDAVLRLREEGFQTYTQRVEDFMEIPAASIDLVTMFHVIEHVADPIHVVKKVVDWLSPGGIFVVETPNIDSWDAMLFKGRWWGGYHIPRHWTLFQADSLRRLLEAAGLDVLHISYETGHSFWMYSFHHVIKYNSLWPAPKVARWFDPTRALSTLVILTGFEVIRKTLGARTSAMLMIARRRASRPSDRELATK